MPPILPAAYRNQFEVLASLGRGGRGQVFKVRRQSDGALFALKTLPGATPETVRQFREEVGMMARFSHPNLVRVRDYFEGPPPAYLMDLIEGPSLKEALEQSPPETVLSIFAGCCRALHFLHARGLLHRDVKPANILVASDGTPKLIDFGLPGFGTPAYWAPEAKAGLYDARSELYALGISFLESIEGRIDLPEFFRDLLLRMVKEDPSERPSSSLSLLKFLNRQDPELFPVSPDLAGSVLAKTPWVERPEEMAFREMEKIARIIFVTGPTGIGRSRFVEEMTWRRKLTGLRCTAIADFHLLSESDKKSAELSVRSALRDPSHLVLIEYDSDRFSETEAMTFATALPKDRLAMVLELKDLPKKQSIALLRKATEDDPWPEKDYETAARSAGGRPLLLVEALRQRLIQGADQAVTSFESACKARVAELAQETSREGLRLLSLVLAADAPAVRSDFEQIGPWNSFEDAERVLRTSGILAGAYHLELAHPSLASSFEKALPAEAMTSAHAAWKTALAASHETAKNHPDAPRILHHALKCGDPETARRWLLPAMEFLFGSGRFGEIVRLAPVLATLCAERMDRVVLQGYLAPCLYRLGRHDEALAAYDDWYATKGDDETRVETIKHRLFTGQVLFAQGRLNEARKRLEDCLKTGDADLNERLKSYHARAHVLLAAVDEHEENLLDALKHLDLAQPLAGLGTVLRAEVENQRGLLHQKNGDYARARSCFEASIKASSEAKSPQSEAIGHNNLGILDRERGDFAQALSSLDKAVALAQEGGEIVQLARYLENRALVLKELARFDRAFPEMAEAHDLLLVYGNAEERRLSEIHFQGLEGLTLGDIGLDLDGQELDRREGPRFHALKALRAMETGSATEADLVAALEGISALQSPLLRADFYARLAELLKALDLKGLADRVSWKAREELTYIQHRLPEELQWMKVKPAA